MPGCGLRLLCGGERHSAPGHSAARVATIRLVYSAGVIESAAASLQLVTTSAAVFTSCDSQRPSLDASGRLWTHSGSRLPRLLTSPSNSTDYQRILHPTSAPSSSCSSPTHPRDATHGSQSSPTCIITVLPAAASHSPTLAIDEAKDAPILLPLRIAAGPVRDVYEHNGLPTPRKSGWSSIGELTLARRKER